MKTLRTLVGTAWDFFADAARNDSESEDEGLIGDLIALNETLDKFAELID